MNPKSAFGNMILKGLTMPNSDSTLPDGAFRFDFRDDVGFVFSVCVWTQTPAARKVAEDYMHEVDGDLLRSGYRNEFRSYWVNRSKCSRRAIREYLANKGFEEIGEDHPLWIEMEEEDKAKRESESLSWFVQKAKEIAHFRNMLAERPNGASVLNSMIRELELRVTLNRKVITSHPRCQPLFEENEKVEVSLSWDWSGWVLVISDKSPPPPNTLPMADIRFLATYDEGKRLFKAALAGEPIPHTEVDTND